MHECSIQERASVTSLVQSSLWAHTGKTLALLASGAVVVVGQMYTVVPLYSRMEVSFHVAPTVMALTSTVFGFAYAVGFLAVGPMSDRFGPRRMIIGGLVATAMATVGIAVVPTFGDVIALRMLQGLSAATFTPSALSYVSRHVRPERRAVVISCVTSSMLAAAILMQILAQVVAGPLGWQAVFLLSSLLLVLVAVAAWATLLPSQTSQTTTMKAAFGAMPRLAARPQLLSLYLSTITLLGGFVALYTTLALAGPASIANRPDALFLLRLSGLPAMVAVPLLAPALARFAPLTRAVGGLAAAASAAFMVSIMDNDAVAIAALLLVFLAGLTVAAPALVEAIGAAAPGNGGAAISLYAFSMFAGGSIGGQAMSARIGFGFGGNLRLIALALALGTGLVLLSRVLSVLRSQDIATHS